MFPPSLNTPVPPQHGAVFGAVLVIYLLKKKKKRSLMQCQCSFARVVSAQTTTVRLIYELSALEQFQSTKKTNPYIYYFLLISGFVLHLSSACPRVNRCTCDVGQVCFKRKEKNLISLGFKGKLIEWMFGGLLMLLPLRISVETFNKQRHRGTKTSKLKKKKKKTL